MKKIMIVMSVLLLLSAGAVYASNKPVLLFGQYDVKAGLSRYCDNDNLVYIWKIYSNKGQATSIAVVPNGCKKGN